MRVPSWAAAFFVGSLYVRSICALPVEVVGNVDGIAFDNLYVRPNQQVLTTTAFPRADVWLFDTNEPLPVTPLLIGEFPYATSSLGITDLGCGHPPDVYYGIGGNFTLSNFTPIANTFNLYKIDMRPFVTFNNTVQHPPIISMAAPLHEITQPNGFTRYGDSILLVSDSTQGAVYAVDMTNTEKPEVKLLSQDPSMGPNNSAPQQLRFGVNGIRASGNTLFYCNSGFHTMWSLPLELVEGSNIPVPAASPRLIAENCFCDDFAFDADRGMLWVASPAGAILGVNVATGAQSVIAGVPGNLSAGISAATSAQLGYADRYLYATVIGSAATIAPTGWRGLRRVDLFALPSNYSTGT